MKITQIVDSFKRGYHKPSTMPLWKLMIIYIVWNICLIGYVSAIFVSLWFVIIGIIFQSLAFFLHCKWDTGSWRCTDQGKEYIRKYEQ